MSDNNVDKTFNNPLGYVIKQFGGNTDGNSVAIDRKNRIVVIGNTSEGDNTNTSMFITRYNANGTLDDTFNGTGYVIKQFTDGIDTYGNSVAIDSVGRIVVTGYTFVLVDTFYITMFITRYNTDGTLDDTFNGTGYVIKQFTTGKSTIGRSVAIDSFGRIVVTGDTIEGDNTTDSMFITRYNTNGTLDDTFNGTGDVIKQFTIGKNTIGYSVTIDNVSRIVVTGYTIEDDNTTHSMFITRYNTNGTLDDTFNGTGYIIKQFTIGGNTVGLSVAIDNSGRIVVTGVTGESAFINSMFITRYLSDGKIDPSFPSGGVITKGYTTGGANFGQSVAIDSSDRIVVTGITGVVNNPDTVSMFITRYSANGTLDTSFSGGFITKQYTSGKGTSGNSVAIDSSNRIVVTGNTFDNTDTASMFITRYLGDNITTTTTTTTSTTTTTTEPTNTTTTTEPTTTTTTTEPTTTTTTEPICVPAGTPILTDQGIVAIDQIDTKIHTINNRRIIAVTTTITPEKNLVCFEANSMGINCPTKRTIMTPGHEVLYRGKLVQAKHFVGRVEGVHTVPYNGKDVLYNVLQEKHGLMSVNNMVLETLHPENKVAKEILKKRYLQ